MMETMMEILFEHLLEIVCSVVGIVLTAYVIPWLKDKRLYGLVETFVKSAEKQAQTAKIDKHEYVLEALDSLGIKYTEKVAGMIESAVMELDLAVAQSFIVETAKEELN